jgi:hypothetical protein
MIFSISIVFAVAALFFIVVIIRRLRFVEEMEKSWAEYRKAEQVLREQYAALNSPPERDKIHEVIGYDS